MKNKVQLITYPDSLGENLQDLKKALDENLQGKIGGVHILPFYPSSGDRGFAPLTHKKVDPEFGDWEDIKKISKKYDLMADLVINHVSSESKIFQDYLKNGRKSKYKDYFISASKFSKRIDERKLKGTRKKIVNFISRGMNFFRKMDKLFHLKGVNRFVLKKIYRPRKGSPFDTFKLHNGREAILWCTFSNSQIDLDLENKNVQKMFTRAMSLMAEKRVNLLRLDAVGYAIKKRGTTNFMISETYDLITNLARKAHHRGIKIIPEIHNHYTMQLKLARQEGVDYVYDFCLPALVLHSISSKNFQQLKHWIRIRPENQITTLDTHDGIGMIDVEDLLSKKEIEKLTQEIYSKGGNATLRASGESSQNVDIYQINATYFSALGENEWDYLAARAIQFFIPGIPQVYYVGWLAGKNDEEKLEETGVGRDINRHNYTLEEIKKERKRDVVEKLEKLMEFRSNYPAFNGDFKMLRTSKNQLELEWKKGRSFCKLFVDLKNREAWIEYFDKKMGRVEKWNYEK